MNKKFQEYEFLITEELSDIRLDKALALHPEINSRSQATSLIDRGFVTLHSESVKPSRLTKQNEIYKIFVPKTSFDQLVPYDFPLEIIYDDTDLLVVNKPHGLVVHPAFGHEQDTLVNALLHKYTNLPILTDSFRPGLVHRIDKDTCGLLVIAKNEKSLTHLANQFKNKTTHRIYHALASGIFKTTSGSYVSYLKRSDTDRKKFASEKIGPLGTYKGKKAITHYRVISADEKYKISLVELKLETGRTHQIRVHLSEAHHSIIGDPVYGRRSKNTYIEKFLNLNKMFLLAKELGFIHPSTEKEMFFSTDWPSELQQVLLASGLTK